MGKNPTRIFMLSAGAISGAFQVMIDIIEHVDKNRFKMYIGYKPEYSEWGKHEIDLITKAGGTVVPLRGEWLFDLRGFIDLWISLHRERIDILHLWDVLGIPSRFLGKLAGLGVRGLTEAAEGESGRLAGILTHTESASGSVFWPPGRVCLR